MPNDDIRIISRNSLYEGHSTLSQYRLRHRLFGGGWSDEISRELLERGDAVCVLPYDPVRDEVVLIEQFRLGAYVAGVSSWQTEIVAGLVEPGESNEDVARRELMEEAGCTAKELHFICSGLSSSGIMAELAAIYCAIVDATGAGGIHGLDHEHEDIRVTARPFADAMRLLEDGVFQHCHGIIALQWLAANRDRLRAASGEKPQ